MLGENPYFAWDRLHDLDADRPASAMTREFLNAVQAATPTPVCQRCGRDPDGGIRLCWECELLEPIEPLKF